MNPDLSCPAEVGFDLLEPQVAKDPGPYFARLRSTCPVAKASQAALAEFVGYLGSQLAERRRAPRHDMLTEIVEFEVDGRRLTQEEAQGLTYVLVTAGFETTVGGIGGMLHHLAAKPDVRDRLLAEPRLINRAVEEAIRLETPLMASAASPARTPRSGE